MYIAIPIITDSKLLIYQPLMLNRIFKREKIVIRSSKINSLNPLVSKTIVGLFKNYPDLKVKIDRRMIHFESELKDKTIVLSLETKYLPFRLKDLLGKGIIN
jgi:hypothetical protein